MKKLLFTITVSVFGLSLTNAQLDISFGAKAGLNVSTIGGDFGISDIDNFTNTKSRVGFHVGGLAEVKLSEKFAVQPELLFSLQGSKIEYRDPVFPEDNEDVTTTLSYINLPIMAKFFPIEGLSVEAGPQVGFLISDKTKSSIPDGVNDNTFSYKTFDFGLNIGAGYRMENGLLFQARYNFGLAKIDDTPDPISGLGVFGNTFSRKNRNFQLSVGYFFM